MFDEGIIGFIMRIAYTALFFLTGMLLGLCCGGIFHDFIMSFGMLALVVGGWFLGGLEQKWLYSGKINGKTVLSIMLLATQVYILSVLEYVADYVEPFLGQDIPLNKCFQLHGKAGIKWTLLAIAFCIITVVIDCGWKKHETKRLAEASERFRQEEAEREQRIHEERVNQYYEEFQAQEEARAHFERDYRKKNGYSDQNTAGTSNTSGNEKQTSSYFFGCTTKEQIQKRYRDLCKVYHPDMGNGSAEIFDQINKEYEQLKREV